MTRPAGVRPDGGAGVRPARIERKEDHEVIQPPLHLGHAIDKSPVVGFDLDAIARAEQALAELSGDFDSWMRQETETLVAARARAHAAQFAADALSALFHAAHDIKGEAKTLGYPLAGMAAASLCRLIEDTRDSGQLPVVLIDQHVDAIRAMIREGAGADNDTARRLTERLGEVTEDFLARRAAPGGACRDNDSTGSDDPYPDRVVGETG